MKSDNSEMMVIVFVIALVGTAALLAALAIFALLAFAAFVITIIALFAWNRPLSLGELTLMPEEARAFVIRGAGAAILLPSFFLFCQAFFGLKVNWTYLLEFMGIGYVLGSAGLEVAMANGTVPVPAQTVIAPTRALPPPSRPEPEPVTIDAKPFRYASWDDEMDEDAVKPKNCEACAFYHASNSMTFER